MNLKFIALVPLFIANLAYANTELSQLDKLSTCSSQEQKISAQQVLTFFENFKWWKIKNLVSSLHPEYMEWHASRVYLATLYPADVVPHLPYKNGLVKRQDFILNLATIAYSNDVPKYTIDFSRIECVGNDTVVLSSVFNGVNIYRNPQGKALYQTEVKNVPTRFIVTLKDGLVYRNTIDLADETSKNMIEQLGALIKAGVPNVTPGMIPDAKLEDILADFENQAK